MKFVLIRQLFIRNSYTVFHENTTKTSEADARSQTDWRTDERTDGRTDGRTGGRAGGRTAGQTGIVSQYDFLFF